MIFGSGCPHWFIGFGSSACVGVFGVGVCGGLVVVGGCGFVCVDQVVKGTRWMPWHQEPMKDVGACDKPRVVGNRTLIRGFPNGETRLESCPVTRI